MVPRRCRTRSGARTRRDTRKSTCRSALNPVQGMPFSWTLNPYRGCTHACHYCFARRYQTQYELGSGDEFSSVILVKTNIADVLTRELDSPSWTAGTGRARHRYRSVSADRRSLQADAAVLDALAAARTPVGLVTKGPMVVRDRDVLLDGTTRAGCTVYISVPSSRRGGLAGARARHGASAAATARRARAPRRRNQRRRADGADGARLHRLSRSSSKRTVKAIADHGAAFIGANVLYLKDGTSDHFMGFLRGSSRTWWTATGDCTPASTRRRPTCATCRRWCRPCKPATACSGARAARQVPLDERPTAQPVQTDFSWDR